MVVGNRRSGAGPLEGEPEAKGGPSAARAASLPCTTHTAAVGFTSEAHPLREGSEAQGRAWGSAEACLRCGSSQKQDCRMVRGRAIGNEAPQGPGPGLS